MKNGMLQRKAATSRAYDNNTNSCNNVDNILESFSKQLTEEEKLVHSLAGQCTKTFRGHMNNL